MMKKVESKLKEKKGSSSPMTIAATIIVGVLFLILLSHFIYLYSMILGLSDYIQEAVVQTATSNAYNAYNGVREGNSSAHIYAGNGTWNEMVSTGEIMVRLEEMLELDPKNNGLYLYDGGELRYGISDINIHCSNVSLGAGNDVSLTFNTKATIELPIKFLGGTLHVKKVVSLKSYFTPRF